MRRLCTHKRWLDVARHAKWMSAAAGASGDRVLASPSNNRSDRIEYLRSCDERRYHYAKPPSIGYVRCRENRRGRYCGDATDNIWTTAMMDCMITTHTHTHRERERERERAIHVHIDRAIERDALMLACRRLILQHVKRWTSTISCRSPGIPLLLYITCSVSSAYSASLVRRYIYLS